MSSPVSTHAARSALNNDSALRKWAEQWLKAKERLVQPNLSDEEFDKHWSYVRPERMHEGAVEALTAYHQTE